MAKTQIEIKSALRSAKLTELQEWVFKRSLDGLKHREIADEIGRSRQFVSKTIAISIKKLRRIAPIFERKLATMSKL